MEQLTYKTVTNSEELKRVQALAYDIWHEHYVPLIGIDQVRYMLNWMYSLTQLESDLKDGVIFELAFDQNEDLGFCGYGPFEADMSKLHKLYVKNTARKKGIGTQFMHSFENYSLSASKTAMLINVNKGNHLAIRRYENYGFKKWQEVVVDIGQGFVMDDFIMRKELINEKR